MKNINIVFDEQTELDLQLYKLTKTTDEYYLFEWADIIPYTSEYKKMILVFKNKIRYITYDE